MDEKMIRAMVSAGAIQNISIIGHGARFHIEANTPNGAVTAETKKGKIKTWVTLDAAARWVRSIGVGSASVNLARWQPGQKSLPIQPSCSGESHSASHSASHSSAGVKLAHQQPGQKSLPI
jgi:hypothetical protein